MTNSYYFCLWADANKVLWLYRCSLAKNLLRVMFKRWDFYKGTQVFEKSYHFCWSEAIYVLEREKRQTKEIEPHGIQTNTIFQHVHCASLKSKAHIHTDTHDIKRIYKWRKIPFMLFLHIKNLLIITYGFVCWFISVYLNFNPSSWVMAK